jgi:hypothetical protein
MEASQIGRCPEPETNRPGRTRAGAFSGCRGLHRPAGMCSEVVSSLCAWVRTAVASVVVNRDASRRTQDVMGFRGVLGAHVYGRHEPARFVCSNRKQCQARRSKSLPDASEMIAESRVSREINDAVRRFNHISAPQSPIRPNPTHGQDQCDGTEATAPPRPEQ